MKTEMTAGNVPVFVKYDQILMPNNLKDWESVPFAFCTEDKSPEAKKHKYLNLDRWRFCEGLLYDELRCPYCGYIATQTGTCPNCSKGYPTFHKEWYWAKTFKAWANWMKKREYMKLTNYCEGCSGSFWEIAFPDETGPYGFMPGYWVHRGMWSYFDGKKLHLKSSAPPSFCVGSADTQYRYNRRITIQYRVYGKVQKLTELQIHQLERRIKEREKD